MSEELYRCICHTCGTERLIDGLEEAQQVFNDHAERAHEVELLNHRSRRAPSGESAADDRDGDEGTDDA